MAQGINARQVKNHNEAVVLDLVRRHQPISRYEIAELSGLTPTTISSVIARLLPLGIVAEGPSKASRSQDHAGRRRIPLSLVASSRLAGGILVHRTGLEGVVVDLGGTIHTKARDPWHHQLFGYAMRTVADRIRAMQTHLSGELPASLKRNLVGYGVGVPSRTPEGWTWDGVRSSMTDSINHLIVWSNNAVASAYGEWWTGSLPQRPSILYLFFGGGIGGCWIQSAGTHELPKFQAVEVGHLGMAVNGPRCYCGSSGCLERLIGLGQTTLDARGSQHILAYAIQSLALLFKVDLIILGGPRIEGMSDTSFEFLRESLSSCVPIQAATVQGTARAVGTAVTVFQHDFIPCRTPVSDGLRLEHPAAWGQQIQ